jgi:hypothetical protein
VVLSCGRAKDTSGSIQKENTFNQLSYSMMLAALSSIEKVNAASVFLSRSTGI